MQISKRLKMPWRKPGKRRRSGGRQPSRERAAVCHKVVEYFLTNADPMAGELTWMMGRPIRYTPFEITKGFQERANYMIDIAEQALADIVGSGASGV